MMAVALAIAKSKHLEQHIHIRSDSEYVVGHDRVAGRLETARLEEQQRKACEEQVALGTS